MLAGGKPMARSRWDRSWWQCMPSACQRGLLCSKLGYIPGNPARSEFSEASPRPSALGQRGLLCGVKEKKSGLVKIPIGTTGRSRMKHIDCRQGWVRQLRDANIVKPVDVNTKDNLSDLFTKLMVGACFQQLRDRCMVTVPRRQEAGNKEEDASRRRCNETGDPD